MDSEATATAAMAMATATASLPGIAKCTGECTTTRRAASFFGR